jgi:hypothetical protein
VGWRRGAADLAVFAATLGPVLIAVSPGTFTVASMLRVDVLRIITPVSLRG